MRTVLILGATGRIGRIAVRRALAAGLEVRAFAGKASPEPGVESVVGDIRRPDDVARALAGVDAAIAALGPRANTPEAALDIETGMRNIVAAAEAAGVRRVVTLSGAGVDVPGDRKPFLDRVASAIVRRAARHVVGGKQREYEVLASTALDWTALRPPLVIDGPARGTGWIRPCSPASGSPARMSARRSSTSYRVRRSCEGRRLSCRHGGRQPTAERTLASWSLA